MGSINAREDHVIMKSLDPQLAAAKFIIPMKLLCWLVVSNMNFIFHNIIYGMSSFPLTNSYFFQKWLQPPVCIKSMRFLPGKLRDIDRFYHSSIVDIV